MLGVREIEHENNIKKIKLKFPSLKWYKWSNLTKRCFVRKEIIPENSLKPTQFKVVSLVEIGEDTARDIGARGLTNLSTFMGKTGQRDDSKETNKQNWFFSTRPLPATCSRNYCRTNTNSTWVFFRLM